MSEIESPGFWARKRLPNQAMTSVTVPRVHSLRLRRDIIRALGDR